MCHNIHLTIVKNIIILLILIFSVEVGITKNVILTVLRK